MKKFFVMAGLIISASFVFCGKVPAVSGAEVLPPIAESQAYKDFLKKPGNDLAKMICVLNYFRNAPVMVQYEGVDYLPQVAYPFGLVYLMTNYRNENPEEWVRKTSYRSLANNSIIYFKFKDGSYRPMRDVLIEKLKELEEALDKQASKA